MSNQGHYRFEIQELVAWCMRAETLCRTPEDKLAVLDSFIRGVEDIRQKYGLTKKRTVDKVYKRNKIRDDRKHTLPDSGLVPESIPERVDRQECSYPNGCPLRGGCRDACYAGLQGSGDGDGNEDC